MSMIRVQNERYFYQKDKKIKWLWEEKSSYINWYKYSTLGSCSTKSSLFLREAENSIKITQNESLQIYIIL